MPSLAIRAKEPKMTHVSIYVPSYPSTHPRTYTFTTEKSGGFRGFNQRWNFQLCFSTANVVLSFTEPACQTGAYP